jgi:hypothetical protein
MLIPGKHLENGTSIAQVPVESYLDMKDGSNYARMPGPVVMHPEFAARMWVAFGCAPLVVRGAAPEAARAVLDKRMGVSRAV